MQDVELQVVVLFGVSPASDSGGQRSVDSTQMSCRFLAKPTANRPRTPVNSLRPFDCPQSHFLSTLLNRKLRAFKNVVYSDGSGLLDDRAN